MISVGYFVLFLHLKICCEYSLEAPWWGASNEYSQHVFHGEPENILLELSLNTPLITKYSSLITSLLEHSLPVDLWTEKLSKVTAKYLKSVNDK